MMVVASVLQGWAMIKKGNLVSQHSTDFMDLQKGADMLIWDDTHSHQIEDEFRVLVCKSIDLKYLYGLVCQFSPIHPLTTLPSLVYPAAVHMLAGVLHAICPLLWVPREVTPTP